MRVLLFGLIAISLAAQSQAAIIVSEDFESYADTAAMQANWGSAGLGTLDTTAGNPGNSAFHGGGAVNNWQTSFSVAPTATESVVLTADIFNDGANANKRLSVGLRNGANPLFEMGHWNTPSEHYFVRVVAMYGSESWVPISTGLLAAEGNTPGWNRFQATFTPTQLTVTLDLGADGSIDGTFISTGAGASANAFTDLRFGGPSGSSSAGGGASFDNIRLETVAVPEPSSLALLGLFGAAPFVRRRRK